MGINFIETKPFVYKNLDYDGIGATEKKDVYHFKIRGHASGNVFEETNLKYCDGNRGLFERVLNCNLNSI